MALKLDAVTDGIERKEEIKNELLIGEKET
jgi:hypothetical protein